MCRDNGASQMGMSEALGNFNQHTEDARSTSEIVCIARDISGESFSHRVEF